MSVTRVKTILENYSNKNLTNAQMKQFVEDYLVGYDATRDVSDWTNDQLAEVFLAESRKYLKDVAQRGAAIVYDRSKDAERQAERDAVGDIVEEEN